MYSRKFLVPPLKLFFKLWISDVSGLGNIPKYKPAVVISNHQSYFDFLAFTSIINREIRYLAAEKLFDHTILGFLMRLTNQIKVDRYLPDKTNSLKEARKALEESYLLGIFPEGTRSRSGKLQKAFNGAVRIAMDMHVPIIPVGIEGTFQILPPHRDFPTFSRCKFNIGTPINIHHGLKYSHDKEFINNLTTHLMHEVADLSNQNYDHGKKRLFKSFMNLTSNHKVAIIDLDNTVIRGQSQMYFIKYLKKKKLIDTVSYNKLIIFFILYKLHLIPLTDTIRNYLYKAFKGKSYEEYSHHVKQFVEHELKKRIFNEAKEEIKKLQLLNYKIILCSTAWSPIVWSIAKLLNIKHVIATKIEVKDRKLTGRVLGLPVYGLNKVKLVNNYCRRKNFNLKNSIGYADHASDIPLLELVDFPIAVNPDDAMLKEAREKKWKILNWKND